MCGDGGEVARGGGEAIKVLQKALMFLFVIFPELSLSGSLSGSLSDIIEMNVSTFGRKVNFRLGIYEVKVPGYASEPRLNTPVSDHEYIMYLRN